MKKRQIILTTLAVILATLGVFANTLRATKYYRSRYPASWGYPSLDCYVEITSPPCQDRPGVQCTGPFTWVPPGTVIPVIQDFWISKIVDNGDCDAVRRLQ